MTVGQGSSGVRLRIFGGVEVELDADVDEEGDELLPEVFVLTLIYIPILLDFQAIMCHCYYP